MIYDNLEDMQSILRAKIMDNYYDAISDYDASDTEHTSYTIYLKGKERDRRIAEMEAYSIDELKERMLYYKASDEFTDFKCFRFERISNGTLSKQDIDLYKHEQLRLTCPSLDYRTNVMAQVDGASLQKGTNDLFLKLRDPFGSILAVRRGHKDSPEAGPAAQPKPSELIGNYYKVTLGFFYNSPMVLIHGLVAVEPSDSPINLKVERGPIEHLKPKSR